MIRHRVPALFALAGSSLFGAYTYYYSDTLTSINTGTWTQNGVLSAGSSGLTTTDTSGGSLISSVAVPDGTSDYEVKSTLHLAPTLFSSNGGTFVTYVHASSDAMSGPSAPGRRLRSSYRMSRILPAVLARPHWPATRLSAAA